VAPAALFGSEQHQELLARIVYLVQSRGFGLVTGEVGSGKSTAIRALPTPWTAPGTPCCTSRNQA
jgi:type II secretory pathway predicted ATPase ExeA